jgi:FixJ family two-component response regulator
MVHGPFRLPHEIPIVIFTGTVVTRDWAATHDCAGFVKKPIEEQELLDELRSVLSPSTIQ